MAARHETPAAAASWSASWHELISPNQRKKIGQSKPFFRKFLSYPTKSPGNKSLNFSGFRNKIVFPFGVPKKFESVGSAGGEIPIDLPFFQAIKGELGRVHPPWN